MVYDDLVLCRLMMRMYSLIYIDENNTVQAERGPELWQEYQAMEEELIRGFQQHQINPVPIVVVSDFSGRIKAMKELVFCDTTHTLPIPEDIYALIGNYGVPAFAAPPTPPVLRLGYSGRLYDFKTKTRLVTDGLQIGSLSKILLDIFALKKMTVDGISCRLTHELLHVFGVSEEQMDSYKSRAFFEIKNQLQPFAETVAATVRETEVAFRANAAAVAEEHPQWVKKMVELAGRLHLEGFPALPENVLTAGISFPEKAISKDNIDWRCHDILFM